MRHRARLYGRRMRRLPLVLALACAAALPAPAHAADPDGYFSQIPGAGGCITEDPAAPAAPADCADGRGLEGAEAVVLSPDEKFAYVYSYDSGAIAVLTRDAATGALGQSDDPSACFAPAGQGGCTNGRLSASSSDSAHAIAVSGTHLFAASASRHMISVLDRDAATGGLDEPDGAATCFSASGQDADATAGGCTEDDTIIRPQALAISPDGGFLYVSGNGPVGLYGFSIDDDSGALTPLPGDAWCHAATVVAGCTQSRLTRSMYDLTLSHDGSTLYAANIDDSAVVAFTRDAGTGELTEIAGPGGCVLDGSAGDPGDPCTEGHGLAGAQSVELSADDSLLSVGAYDGPGIAMLRVAGDGSLSQAAGAAGCVNELGSDGCGISRVSQNVYRTLFSPDGGTLIAAGYAAGDEVSGIGVFDVAADGTLSQRAGPRGCLSASGADGSGTAGTCATARGVLGPVGLAGTADGRWLYATGYSDDAVAGFRLQHPPACAAASAVAAVATAVTVPLSCTDADGDAVTISRVDGPAHGTVGITGSSAVYTPAAGFVGTDSFRVKGTDGLDESAPATVTIRVVPRPSVPGPGVPGKVAPLALSMRAKPKRDRTLPYKFRFKGKLTPAAGAACSGEVVVTLKRGRKRVARKRATLSSACTYRVVVKIKNRRKLGKKRSGKLTAKARYTGNTAMLERMSRKVTVRYGLS